MFWEFFFVNTHNFVSESPTTQCKNEVRIWSGKPHISKWPKSGCNRWNMVNIIHIYAKQCEIMQIMFWAYELSWATELSWDTVLSWATELNWAAILFPTMYEISIVEKVLIFKLCVPALSKVRWSRFVSAKMIVFRAIFWRKSLIRTILTIWTPLSVIHR